MENLTNNDWLGFITSFDDPKVNLIKCWIYGMLSRNIAAHIKIIHKKQRRFRVGFSGLNQQIRMFTDKEAFKTNIMKRHSIWVHKPRATRRWRLHHPIRDC